MTMKRDAQQLLLAGTLLVATGCTSFVVHNSAEVIGTKVSDDSTTITYFGSYWGLKWSGPDRIPTDNDYVGMKKVISHSNLGYSLASVLTLGIWVPMTIEYWGLEPMSDDADGGELPPEGGDGEQ